MDSIEQKLAEFLFDDRSRHFEIGQKIHTHIRV